MPDRSSMHHRVARGVALVLSVGLGSFVIVNAQLGCDSPATNAPPPKDAEPTPTPEPPPKAESEPAVANPAAQVDPAPQTDPAPNPAPNPAPEPEVVSEPVYMPASKSGGDFGSMRFPGEQSAAQQQQNPAPKK